MGCVIPHLLRNGTATWIPLSIPGVHLLRSTLPTPASPHHLALPNSLTYNSQNAPERTVCRQRSRTDTTCSGNSSKFGLDWSMWRPQGAGQGGRTLGPAEQLTQLFLPCRGGVGGDRFLNHLKLLSLSVNRGCNTALQICAENRARSDVCKCQAQKQTVGRGGGTPYALHQGAGFCLVAGEGSERDVKLGKSDCCC